MKKNSRIVIDLLKQQTKETTKQSEESENFHSDLRDKTSKAEELQKSILPSEHLIKRYLPEFFVLNKPKDRISGDFYWFDVKDDKIIIAAVDCTGHGVSGAFMSINGHHLLNQAIYLEENLKASEILSRINNEVIKELRQQEKETLSINLIDIALCVIDEDKRSLQFAGAKNSLYILRNREVIEVKADKFSIGTTFDGKIKPFSNNQVQLYPHDTIYMFSNGYADQIGGDDGDQKFLYPYFRELLILIGNEPLEQQKYLLDQNIENWKGEIEQLDDILVMGFRI